MLKWLVSIYEMIKKGYNILSIKDIHWNAHGTFIKYGILFWMPGI